ncbi:collagen alpha-2(I) chain-like isoform X2 [Rhincodon typus]|nr:collagen alpha-2(I) chain-like isoform X2 [Rhincodon typus]XP_048476800.1 collagen alpha-2(I) chain-like isoform X2 [Rhincodon typus]
MEASTSGSKLPSPKLSVHKAAFENLHRQQQDELFCDAILYVEGEGIPVHRCVLAAFSPFFLQQFSMRDAHPQKVTLELPGLRAATLKALLRFMYTEQIQLPRNETTEGFLQMARRLGVLGFTGRRGTPPAAEPPGSHVPQGESLPRAPPKAAVLSGQGPSPSEKTRGSVTDSRPKAPSVSSSSSLLQRSRGNRSETPANTPPSNLVTSWRRMRVSRPTPAQTANAGSVSGATPCPRRQWRQRRGRSVGDPAPPAGAVTDQPPRLPARAPTSPTNQPTRFHLPGSHPGGDGPSGPGGPEPAGVTAAQADQGSARQEESEPAKSPGSDLGGGLGPVKLPRESMSSSVPAGHLDQTGQSLALRERHEVSPKRGPSPSHCQQPTAAKDTQQELCSPAWPEQTCQVVSSPARRKAGEGIGLVSEPGLPHPTALPKGIGTDKEESTTARVGKRSSCRGTAPERPPGITKFKLQKLTHSSEWVVIPIPESQDPGQARGQNVGAGDGGWIWTAGGLQPPTGNRGEGKGRRVARRKSLINLTHPVTGLDKNGQRLEGLGGGQRLEGLGVEQRPQEVDISQRSGFNQRVAVHQTLGGLVQDEVVGPSECSPVCNSPSGPEQTWPTTATMFPWETRVQGAPDRPDQCGLALPQITGQDGASPTTGEWGFARLCAGAQDGISTSADLWESARWQFGGQHRTAEEPMVSSPSSEGEEVDVGDSRDVGLLPLVTVRPDASPPPSTPLGCTEIDVVG